MDRVSRQESSASDDVAKLRAKEEKEPVASFLKMRLIELSPGYARVVMKIMPEYQNFNGLVFGGIIMALADQAFAYASNSTAYPSIASHVLAARRPGVFRDVSRSGPLRETCWPANQRLASFPRPRRAASLDGESR